MILADTAIWIDHLRAGDTALTTLLDTGRVLTHPHIIGELALGRIAQRDLVLHSLQSLPAAYTATDVEVLRFIDANALIGTGIGYVDAHLLAAVRLTPGSALWTGNHRLSKVAEALALAWRPAP